MKSMRVLLLAPALGLAAPLSLSSALEEGMRNGPGAQVLKNSVDSSRQFVRKTKSVAFPTVTAYANAGVGQQPNTMGDAFAGLGQMLGSHESRLNVLDSINNVARQQGGAFPAMNNDPYYSYNWGVQVQQALFTFGKVSTALRMASSQESITRAMTAQTRIALQEEILNAFTIASLAQARVATVERALERQKETLTRLERDFAAGSGVKAQVLMMRSKAISLQQDLVNARRDADAAGRNFNRVVGRPAESAIELDTAGMPALENAAVPSRDELLREALNRRKDLAGLKEFRMQMEDLASIYSANYLPTIGLLGKFGFNVTSQQASEVKNIASWDQRDWSVGVGLTWTLFDGFKNAGDAGITRASVRTLEVNEGNLKRAIEIAVDNALRRKMAADSGWAAALEGTAAAREARTLYGQTLSMGGGALSDLLQAEENLRLSELGLLSARLERLNAAAGLALVQGRDLINLPEEP